MQKLSGRKECHGGSAFCVSPDLAWEFITTFVAKSALCFRFSVFGRPGGL